MFTKPKSLKEQLLAMKIGEMVEVKNRTYKVPSIRVAVTKLRKEGYDFIVTEQGCIDCCKVTRVK
jgi:hypothetical protein